MKSFSIKELETARESFKSEIAIVENAIAGINVVEMVTPVNRLKQKKIFVEQAKQGIFIKPTFDYDEDLLKKVAAKRAELYHIEDQLNYAKPHPASASHLVHQSLLDAVHQAIKATYLAENMMNQNDDSAKRAINNIYGEPSSETIKLARKVAERNLEQGKLDYPASYKYVLNDEEQELFKGKKVDAEIIKQTFEWAMSQFPEATPWPVIITDKASSIDVRDKNSSGEPQIVIPTNRKVELLKLIELTNHEIGCHWLSSQNAKRLGFVKCDDELVYEGLAAYRDREFSRDFTGTYNLNFVYYIIAIDEAKQKKSFAEVAKAIYDLLPQGVKNREAKAWLYTYRVFRGISNTENPYGYALTKDRAYFEGHNFASELKEKGQEDYLALSTLSYGTFTELMERVDIEEIRNNLIIPRDLSDVLFDYLKRLCV